eukprot:TRINITY_DN12060_c0_g1_i13.p1 TRINITY_DN12060_c0_g1~~TRINITY_DN12060_c0_g1_i13.p1  ORF type:complete len:483 (-),score=77.24 TRINITY_DN12060_c0_g1_i13:181-1599(-)
MNEPITLVSFFPEETPHSCGYCKGEGSLSKGMWAHFMSVGVYQNLLDKGWRRSGRYVYKPTMEKTCCPQYTIRCEAEKYKPSKTQKRVAKKVRNFLLRGSKKSIQNEDPEGKNPTENAAAAKEDSKAENKTDKEESKEEGSDVVDMDKKILGLKKAKIRRLEKRMEKKGYLKDTNKSVSDPKNKEKSISEYLPSLQNCTDSLNSSVSQGGEEFKHKLELRLIRADQKDPQFQQHFQESYEVYKKYQMSIHKDKEDECDQNTYRRFLCASPLKYQHDASSKDDVLMGAFHQHYLLDGKIIAVGVLDILPDCVSSVYLYYDPDYSHLSLGTYTAIRELQLCGVLGRKHYYMGFYIHSCHKMRYKGKYYPSELLSPTSFNWHPIEKCLPFLDQHKFHTFEKDAELMTRKKTLDVTEVKFFLFGAIRPYSPGLAESLSRKSKAMLAAYYEVCDKNAENMVVVLNEDEEEEESSDDE